MHASKDRLVEKLTAFAGASLLILCLFISLNVTFVSRVSECLRHRSVDSPHQEKEEKYLELCSLG